MRGIGRLIAARHDLTVQKELKHVSRVATAITQGHSLEGFVMGCERVCGHDEAPDIMLVGITRNAPERTTAPSAETPASSDPNTILAIGHDGLCQAVARQCGRIWKANKEFHGESPIVPETERAPKVDRGTGAKRSREGQDAPPSDTPTLRNIDVV